ncbi:hypothetical protein B0H14DRAFT_2588007 [Mycena olivaceomarginata]|nr:hypothetical protein B0H14DRAFT_2588007 [Mycena olivaceomarginata]
MPTHSKVQNPSVADPGPPRVYKPVKKYRSEEISLDILIARADEILGTKPFTFQLEAAAAVLCGEDAIIDVGTGCGESVIFVLGLPPSRHGRFATSKMMVWVGVLDALRAVQMGSPPSMKLENATGVGS